MRYVVQLCVHITEARDEISASSRISSSPHCLPTCMHHHPFLSLHVYTYLYALFGNSMLPPIFFSKLGRGRGGG